MQVAIIAVLADMGDVVMEHIPQTVKKWEGGWDLAKWDGDLAERKEI